jgi:hypothetical protein
MYSKSVILFELLSQNWRQFREFLINTYQLECALLKQPTLKSLAVCFDASSNIGAILIK